MFDRERRAAETAYREAVRGLPDEYGEACEDVGYRAALFAEKTGLRASDVAERFAEAVRLSYFQPTALSTMDRLT